MFRLLKSSIFILILVLPQTTSYCTPCHKGRVVCSRPIGGGRILCPLLVFAFPPSVDFSEVIFVCQLGAESVSYVGIPACIIKCKGGGELRCPSTTPTPIDPPSTTPKQDHLGKLFVPVVSVVSTLLALILVIFACLLCRRRLNVVFQRRWELSRNWWQLRKERQAAKRLSESQRSDESAEMSGVEDGGIVNPAAIDIVNPESEFAEVKLFGDEAEKKSEATGGRKISQAEAEKNSEATGGRKISQAEAEKKSEATGSGKINQAEVETKVGGAKGTADGNSQVEKKVGGAKGAAGGTAQVETKVGGAKGTAGGTAQVEKKVGGAKGAAGGTAQVEKKVGGAKGAAGGTAQVEKMSEEAETPQMLLRSVKKAEKIGQVKKTE